MLLRTEYPSFNSPQAELPELTHADLVSGFGRLRTS
jgi:hypothetical protein